tara:strand:- start:2137 stop:2259 length:123 start_codon:yes stop_codon:yes gene_type:complete
LYAVVPGLTGPVIGSHNSFSFSLQINGAGKKVKPTPTKSY